MFFKSDFRLHVTGNEDSLELCEPVTVQIRNSQQGQQVTSEEQSGTRPKVEESELGRKTQ